jgi:two-component system, cell cycle sensor histidine kinase and response regulator CckA
MTDRKLETPTPRRTILIVDDEPQIRLLMKRTLERAGYLVLEADSSATAASLSSKHQGRIDLLIADLIMPRTDGFLTSATLLRARPEMKLLFVSGYAETSASVRENLEELKDTPFLAKPHTPAELLAKVSEVLARPQSRSR